MVRKRDPYIGGIELCRLLPIESTMLPMKRWFLHMQWSRNTFDIEMIPASSCISPSDGTEILNERLSDLAAYLGIHVTYWSRVKCVLQAATLGFLDGGCCCHARRDRHKVEEWPTVWKNTETVFQFGLVRERDRWTWEKERQVLGAATFNGPGGVRVRFLTMYAERIEERNEPSK